MIIGFILLLVAVTELVLGIWFLVRYEKNQATTWYGLFALSAALYCSAVAFGYLLDNPYYTERLSWVGALLISTFILPFSFSFPTAQKKISELLPLVLWPALLFIPALIFTDLLLIDNGVIRDSSGYRTFGGPYLWVAISYFLVYWLWSIINLFNRFRRSDGHHRWQLKMILWSVVSTVVVGIIFDITLPLITKSNLGYLGSLFSVVWVGITSYIILRK